jgi:hypothetical protein
MEGPFGPRLLYSPLTGNAVTTQKEKAACLLVAIVDPEKDPVRSKAFNMSIQISSAFRLRDTSIIP